LIEYAYVQSYYGAGAVYPSDTTHSEVASIGQGNNAADMTWRNSLINCIISTGGIMWNNISDTSSHFYIYGNVFYKPAGANWDNANGIIGGWTSSSTAAFYNVYVYNNTFVNCNQLTLGNLPLTYGGCIAENNLWYTCNAPIFTDFPTHDYNCFISSGTTQSEVHGTTQTGNPFNNYTGLDFTLVSNTAAGVNLGSPYNLDPMGNTRTTWTRGAFEFGTLNTNPVISVSPSSLNFGSILTNTTSQLSFTVKNVGAGTLAGTASVAAPFSNVSGGTYSLAANQSQSVTVLYSPTAPGTNSQTVTFTGGGGTNETVTGVATASASRPQLPSPPENLRVVASH
jgi:hypothetical protein